MDYKAKLKDVLMPPKWRNAMDTDFWLVPESLSGVGRKVLGLRG